MRSITELPGELQALPDRWPPSRVTLAHVTDRLKQTGSALEASPKDIESRAALSHWAAKITTDTCSMVAGPQRFRLRMIWGGTEEARSRIVELLWIHTDGEGFQLASPGHGTWIEPLPAELTRSGAPELQAAVEDAPPWARVLLTGLGRHNEVLSHQQRVASDLLLRSQESTSRTSAMLLEALAGQLQRCNEIIRLQAAELDQLRRENRDLRDRDGTADPLALEKARIDGEVRGRMVDSAIEQGWPIIERVAQHFTGVGAPAAPKSAPASPPPAAPNGAGKG